jgi:hypothetical protein
MVVYHHWSVEWHPRSDPPGGLLRVVCIARRAVSDPFAGPGLFPADVDRAVRFWNLVASGGARGHGAGYEVVWRLSVVADDADGDAPDGAWSDDPTYRARRRLLRWIMYRQCPLFAGHFAVEHFRDHPEYFGLLEPGAERRCGRVRPSVRAPPHAPRTARAR